MTWVFQAKSYLALTIGSLKVLQKIENKTFGDVKTVLKKNKN